MPDVVRPAVTTDAAALHRIAAITFPLAAGFIPAARTAIVTSPGPGSAAA